MGLLSGLLLFPIAGPTRGLLFVLEQIKDRVDAEILDESVVEDALVTLALRHDFGEIQTADYLAQEDALLERLNSIRVYKESLQEQEAVASGSVSE